MQNYKTEKGVCEQCGKEFMYDPHQSKGRFCCWDCRKKAHGKIIKESYTPELRAKHSEAAKRQMQDPNQIEIRKSKRVADKHRKRVDYRSVAIEAHGNICQRCGKEVSGYELVVHHIDGDHYIDEITDNSPDNLMVLCRSCHNKLHNELRKTQDRFFGQTDFEIAANYILEGLKKLGFEIDYDNFHNTPKRFARAYQEIFEGCTDTETKVQEILSTTFPSDGFRDMIIEKDIVCFSMCPHHLLPVEYHVCVGYIPSKTGEVLGISKLSRLVELLAKRPMLQERFTHEIVDYLSRIQIDGAIAVVEGQHMCMRMRGAKAINSTVTTTAISGVFEDDPSAKQEFFEHVSDRKRFS